MLAEDIRQFTGALLLIVGALLPIVNPVGSAPIFLTLTHGLDRPTRTRLAGTVAINSYILLFGSMLIGSYVLRIFDLSVPVVELAGGLVLCRLGWNLLHSDPPAETPVPGEDVETRAFYPLTLPVTVDPGVIAVAIAIGANHGHTFARVGFAYAAGATGVALVALAVWVTYRYADRAAHWLGHTRMMAILRLSAFIVLCIGVQIAWTGGRALLVEAFPSATGAATPAAPASALPAKPAAGQRP